MSVKVLEQSICGETEFAHPTANIRVASGGSVVLVDEAAKSVAALDLARRW